ncbi:DUF1592 domain-containing protein [Lignipirellula cremea]|uniref:Planctomycete cytochrome C n=1 Tax=Lignipirellula cremea TaxID=2528010 RepID=A0A518DXI7_9BACT|nr:DUF1592 domain-containing protein [Lignipirellula cremea]QDU96559.1 hypothetical protein Pla8534_43800 [Lignipirellula cremea]
MISKILYCLLFCSALFASALPLWAEEINRPTDFARHVAPFLQRYCTHCHGDKRQEAELRFDGKAPDLMDAATRKTWERVWVMVASGQMPPKDEPAPSSEEMIPVLDWIREQTAIAEALARRDGGGGNGLRRLTSREQVRVWTDVLDLNYANHRPDFLRFLAQDPRSEHFINRGDRLLMQEEHVNRSLDLAERMLKLVLPDPDRPEPISWTIEPQAIAGNPLQADKFYRQAGGVDRPPALRFPAHGEKPDNPEALLEVHAGCWPHEDGNGMVLNPVYRTRPGLNGFDHIILRYPQPISEGTVRLVIRARAELPAGETALPTLWLDGFCRINNNLKLEGSGGQLPYHKIWPLARLTVPREATDLTVEIPLELTSIDFGSIHKSPHPGLWLMLRNLAVPARVPLFTPSGERKRLGAEGRWRPESARPPKGTAGWCYYPNDIEDGPRVVVERISLTVNHREPDEHSRARRVIGDGRPEQIRVLAERAWGRPVRDEELKPYLDLYAAEAESLGKPAALRQALAGILVAPDCLYLPDRRGEKQQRMIDFSRRLAITLWGSVPDERLRALAASGKLSEPSTLQGEIARMMADHRFTWFAEEFCRQWLGVDDIAGIEGQWAQSSQVDASAYPRNLALQQAFMDEPGRFLLDAIRRNRHVSHLIAPDSLMLNKTLAEFYGVNAPITDGWQRVVELPATRRHGLLSMSGPILVASREEKESQIYRGAYLLTRLLGVEVGTPPANVSTLQALNVNQNFRKKSVREKLQIHVERTCAVCHQKIDPLGFVWEQFDHHGKLLLARDNGPRPVDASGQLPDGRTFTDLDSMCRVLLEHPERNSSFPRAFVRALASYAWGRELTLLDSERIDHLLGDGNPRLADLLTAILADEFQHQGD